MSDLYVAVFDDEFAAAEAQVAVWRMQKEGRIRVDDSAYVIRHPDGRVTLHQELNLVQQRANQIRFVGALASFAVGIVPVGLAGKLADKIDASFMKQVGNTLQPGGSPLFAHGERLQGVAGENAALLQGLGGKLLYTSLSNDAETEAIRRSLEEGA